MTKLRLIMLIAPIFLLFGCSKGSVPSTEITLTETNLTVRSSVTPQPPTVTIPLEASPTPTSYRTPTPIPPTATPTEGIPTIPPEAQLKVECVDVVEESVQDLEFKGSIILQSVISRDNYTELMNMETGVSTVLSQDNINLIYFTNSPDGNWMAYKRVVFDSPEGHVIGRRLVIGTASNQQYTTITWGESWYVLTRWLDNERLAISILGDSPNPQLVLNPFSGRNQMFTLEVPDYFNLYPIPNWDGTGGSVYDPSFTRVVYPRNSSIGDEYVLWDTENKKEITALPTYYIYYTPVWSPDGGQFAVAANLEEMNLYTFELFSVTRDGLITRLTHLTSYYEYLDLQGLSWSPDGRYIAFWLIPYERPRTDEILAILDMQTQEVTNLCLHASTPKMLDWTIPPIWSPDSRHLAFVDLYEQYKSHVIVVDLDEGIAVQVAENMEPVGWLSAGP